MLQLGFSQTGNVFSKDFPAVDAYLRVDFDKQELIYPEDKGLKINERQTCNFKANENFVVFECVCRLFEKGYKPQHIELEPRWQVGHGASGGRADILIRDNDGKALLIIECKTWGDEFDDSWKDTLNGKGQLFTYAHQERSTQYLCLYASGLEDGALKYASHIIAVRDNDDILKRKAAENPPAYRDADSAKELYEVWKRTYECDYATRGIFEPDVQPYQIGKAKYTVADLQTVTEADIQPKYHEFATILRQHNVSGRENAFDKLVNLFLCKIVDEKHNPDDLQFYWRGIAFDSYFDLIDRLQRLYRDGMREFLKEDVTYIDNQTIRDAFKFFKNDPDATRDKILEYFRRQKYFTNNDFSFLDVHNEQLFYQNAAILLKIVRMLQDIRLNGDQQNQFLGDMFEFFLDQGFKQTEGQFFTPLPVTRFIILSLPLETVFSDGQNPPKVIDYACGAGHFLTEMASQLRRLRQGQDVSRFYSQFYGIEKEYRLSKVAKVSAFMYNQDEINIIYADALAQHPDIPEGAFALLVSNPPYSVKGFLETLPEAGRARYTLIETVDPKSYPTNNAIEAFFLERAKQLLAPHGVAGIITPSSILSNAASVYTRVREILLQNFDIIALVELGSGTFGKTGTNTVTLFLRRKDDNPAPADHYRNRVNAWFDGDTGKDGVFADAHLLQAYCDHIGIGLADYQTLLQSNPSPTLLDSEIFKEYRRAFDASGEVKALQKQKSFQQKSAAEQQAELDRQFIQFARKIEREKLYYFILAYTQPCPVIVVRSPQGTDEMKKFLGYEWSAAKGQEGIKYLRGSIDRIETPLFDPQDRYNPEKISTLIRQNFSGQPVSVPESLQPYATVARLVDLLDFSRVSFDKQISLAPKIKVSTQYEQKPLSDICDIVKGVSYSKNDEVDIPTQNAILTADNITLSGRLELKKIVYLKPDIVIEEEKRLKKNDIFICFSSGSLEHLGKVAFIDSDISYYAGGFMGILRVKETNSVLPKYLYEVLNSDTYRNIVRRTGSGANIKNLSSTVSEIKIPVPPPDVQAQIVAECQAIDAEVEQARATIASIQGQLKQIANGLYEKYPFRKLGDVCEPPEYGANEKAIDGNPNEDYRYIRITDINDDGTLNDDFKTATTIDEKYILQDGDFLFARTGATVGKTFLYRSSVGKAIYAGYLIRFRPRPEVLRPAFLALVTKSDRYWEWVQRTQVGAGQPGINSQLYSALEIPLPASLTEQDQYVAQVEQLEKQIESARAVIASAPARRRAALQKYLESA